ncbi:uncharacterized protein BDZ99DRAFT_483180 [Mytilinidion resinicola]|uniref:Uncharacterized protein n=1 Tax=Mytilinidion resinicola TaxID=574789 RepID=A0A6A6Y0J4_9PEZI|nr:uncharacterized protein BDZ99DRAFT_483180 [Mytilinidion resinicola]KAF2802169.1 hypothetical protein BDZ99DRAFT_483180 [Mytilinidion resinicola]
MTSPQSIMIEVDSSMNRAHAEALTLPGLPTEIIEDIVGRLFDSGRKTRSRYKHGKRDLCSLRLVSREMNHKSLCEFGRRIFKGTTDAYWGQRALSLSKTSLQRLEESSEHPVFGPAVQQLNFQLDCYDKEYAKELQGEMMFPRFRFQPIRPDYYRITSIDTRESIYRAVSGLQNCRTVKIDFQSKYNFGKIDAQAAFDWKTWCTDIYTMTHLVAIILRSLLLNGRLLEHLSVGEDDQTNWWTARGLAIDLLYYDIFMRYPNAFSQMRKLDLALCLTDWSIFPFQTDEIFRSAGNTLEHLALRLDLTTRSRDLLHQLAARPISQHLSVLKLTDFWARDADLTSLLGNHAATLKEVEFNRIILGSGSQWATVLQFINTEPFHLRRLKCTYLIQLERQVRYICSYVGVSFVGHHEVFDLDVVDYSNADPTQQQRAHYLGSALVNDKLLKDGDWVAVGLKEAPRRFTIETNHQDFHVELGGLIQRKCSHVQTGSGGHRPGALKCTSSKIYWIIIPYSDFLDQRLNLSELDDAFKQNQYLLPRGPPNPHSPQPLHLYAQKSAHSPSIPSAPASSNRKSGNKYPNPPTTPSPSPPDLICTACTIRFNPNSAFQSTTPGNSVVSKPSNP